MPFFSLSALRTLLATETDNNSSLNQQLMDTIRQNAEALLMLVFSTGVTGAADNNPPNDTTGVLTDAAPGFAVDAHNGRTLLITSGLAIGNLYTIDDTTTTTIVCTGDNLYADGVRAGDTYQIFYDLKNNLDGHNHDDVNSPMVVFPTGTVASLPSMSEEQTALTTTSTSLVSVATYRIYIPANAKYLRASFRLGQASPAYDAIGLFVLNGSNSTQCTLTGSVGPTWQSVIYLDVESLGLSPGLYSLSLQIRTTNAGAAASLQGFTFYWSNT